MRAASRKVYKVRDSSRSPQRRDAWTRSRRASGSRSPARPSVLAPPQMFLSLFHNSHRGYLSALPLALAHINYGQLMEANMPGASRLTKSTLLRILAAAHFPPAGTTVVRSWYRSWDGVAEKRRDSLSRRKKKNNLTMLLRYVCVEKKGHATHVEIASHNKSSGRCDNSESRIYD